jgi:hypothetical protein
MFVLLLLLFQSPSSWTVAPLGVTVGDTIRLTRRVGATPDVRARLQPLGQAGALEALAPPQWFYSEGDLSILYVVSLFEPGRHDIPMPDVELVYADGRAETLAGDTAWIEVLSLLPSEDSAVAPMPSRGPIARPPTSLLPALALVAAALLGTLIWALIRWRPVRRPTPQRANSVRADPPIERWVAAGEPRAVAAVAADRLRRAIAEWLPEAGRHLHTEECIRIVLAQRQGDVGRQVADVLRTLERARFSPAASADVLDVVDSAEAVIAALASAPVES